MSYNNFGGNGRDDRRGGRSDGPGSGRPSGRGGDDRRSDRPSFGSRPSSRDGQSRGSSASGRPQRDGERRSFGDRPARRDGESRGGFGGGERRSFGDRPQRDGDSVDTRAKRGGDPENLPAIPEDIDVSVLPKPVVAELRSLTPGLNRFLMEHLACALNAMEAEDWQLGLAHARAARTRGARIAVVRETCGIAAYHCEEWAEALSELRTYTRITGKTEHLPVMADCERGLGRPERALSIARSQDVGRLDVEGRVEMRIVAAGARRDLGQLDAAVATLECKELTSKSTEPWSARLRYAYADMLLAAGRKTEARDWFVKATLVDEEELTDAAERAVAIEI